MDFRRKAGRLPEDVSGMNSGFDVRSQDENHFWRYIEVKGRAGTSDIMLTGNEMYRMTQFGDGLGCMYYVLCSARLSE